MNDRIELLGVAEIARLFRGSKQTVGNWRSRNKDFPLPVADLKSGPVWKLKQLVEWGQAQDIEIHVDAAAPDATAEDEPHKLAETIALVNMKGGVGKSTLAYNLGWHAAWFRNKKVLFVDLDPQFNLSQMLLSDLGYESHLEDGGKTVLHIFEQLTPGAITGKRTEGLKPEDVVVQHVEWDDGSGLSIIPSQLELAWTLKNPHGKEQLLADFLEPLTTEYDLILIDCPPTESMLTSAAYLASDYILVPVRPEFLSTIGLPLLVRSIEEFHKGHKDKTVELLGIIFNGLGQKREHERSRAYVESVAGENGWHIFEGELSLSDSYAKGSREHKPIFQTPYARTEKKEEFKEAADQILGRAGL